MSLRVTLLGKGMNHNGTHITFWGTIGTASVVLWGLHQSKLRPEYSPAYSQVQTHQVPTQNVAIHVAPKLRTLQESPQRVVVHVTPHLVKEAAAKNVCELRKYAPIEQKEPMYQLASKEEVNGKVAPPELRVTPVIEDIMNSVRPRQITGIIKVEGNEYEFGSGGRGQSIPYGDYLITPDAVGSWGSRHGAIGLANGTIRDPKLNRDRDMIELHAATDSKLETSGCVAIRKDQWPEFRKQVITMVRGNKRIYLHVSEQGASVSIRPFEFIGETISESILLDALGPIEGPARKATE